MSVTFYPETTDSDVVGYALQCACGAARSEVVAQSHGAAVALLTAPVAPKCGDDFCAADNGFVNAIYAGGDSPETNVSNANAGSLLRILGIETDECLCGAMNADAFLGRVLMALATTRDGYAQSRLLELHDVAAHAAQIGRKVVWG